MNDILVGEIVLFRSKLYRSLPVRYGIIWEDTINSYLVQFFDTGEERWISKEYVESISESR